MTKITARDWFKKRPWIDDPYASIDDYVATEAPCKDYDLKKQLEHWRDHGIVIFENAVDTATIDALLSDIDHLVHHPTEFEITVETRGELHRPIKEVTTTELLDRDRLKINNLHFISKAALRCALNRYIGSFLQHVFKDNPCILQSLFFVKGSQQPIHLDYPYVRCQQHIANLAASWVALEDVHEDSGPLEYYCGSHAPEKMPFFDWGNGSILMENDSKREPQEFSNYLADRVKKLGIKPRVFLPKKGDLLIWHGYLAHAGTTINDATRTRKSYVTHYTSKNSYPSLHKHKDADEQGKLYSENGAIYYDAPWTQGWKMLPSWNA
ncbi:MAG: hypothetical protein EXS31_03290 [Pedosphaera sp.]|nr:hypothetical protein [Pedosphaera sp.]